MFFPYIELCLEIILYIGNRFFKKSALGILLFLNQQLELGRNGVIGFGSLSIMKMVLNQVWILLLNFIIGHIIQQALNELLLPEIVHLLRIHLLSIHMSCLRFKPLSMYFLEMLDIVLALKPAQNGPTNKAHP